jgi:hypothetical protein
VGNVGQEEVHPSDPQPDEELENLAAVGPRGYDREGADVQSALLQPLDGGDRPVPAPAATVIYPVRVVVLTQAVDAHPDVDPALDQRIDPRVRYQRAVRLERDLVEPIPELPTRFRDVRAEGPHG